MVADPTPKVTAPPASQDGDRFRWDVDRYLAVVKAGILRPDDRVELLEGEIIKRMGGDFPHIDGISFLIEAIRASLGGGYHVRSQLPLQTLDSVPEPDVLVLRGSHRDYVGRFPQPEEVVLVAEVSNTTLDSDRRRKMGIYARAGIAETWILNVADRQLEVYRRPLPSGVYGETRIFGLEESVEIEGKTLRVVDLLP